MAEAVIVDAVRTPVGKRRGALSGLHPARLLGLAQRGLLDRAGVDAGRSGRSTALVTMCAGGAHSTATIIERI